MKNIWISGTINSGKTTVSKLIGKELKMPVIELDSFSAFVEDWMEFSDLMALNYSLLPEIVEMYNKRGFGIIIVYPLSEKRYVEMGELRDSFEFFAIDPGIEMALTERGERKLTDWERNRISELYKSGINKPSFATWVDTSTHIPSETAEGIISLLSK